MKKAQNIHIAYGDSAKECLTEAMMQGLQGDAVVVSRDDFTQGPISDCIDDGGLVQRTRYWSGLTAINRFGEDVSALYKSTLSDIESIPVGSKVIVWIGDSMHDELATAWLLTYLSNLDLDWYYADLSQCDYDMPIINIALLSPEDIVETQHIIQKLDESKWQYFKTLWETASKENSAYRVRKNEVMLSVDQFYHDEFILSMISKEPLLMEKIIGDIMGMSEHHLSDVTIETRLEYLEKNKKIEINVDNTQFYKSKLRKL